MADERKENAEGANEVLLSCPCCAVAFTQELTLFMHIKVSHGGKPYICGICKKGYATTRSLKYHMELHGKMYRFECVECKKGFRRQDYLQVHIKRYHLGPAGRDFECRLCLKKFVTRAELRSHLQSHNVRQQLKCKLCTKAYATQYFLSVHMVNVHDQEPEKHIYCEKCDVRFIMQSTYDLHVKSDFHNRDRPFKCDQCKARCKRLDSLNFHKQIYHEIGSDGEIEKGQPCPVCQKYGFANKRSVQQHISKVHNRRNGIIPRRRRSERLQNMLRRSLPSLEHSDAEAQPSLIPVEPASSHLAQFAEASDTNDGTVMQIIADRAEDSLTINMQVPHLKPILEELHRQANDNSELASVIRPPPLGMISQANNQLLGFIQAGATVLPGMAPSRSTDQSNHDATTSYFQEQPVQFANSTTASDAFNLRNEMIAFAPPTTMMVESIPEQNLIIQDGNMITINQQIDFDTVVSENLVEEVPAEVITGFPDTSQENELAFHVVPQSFLEQTVRNVNSDHDYFSRSNPMVVANALQSSERVTALPNEPSAWLIRPNTGLANQAIFLRENENGHALNENGSPVAQQENATGQSLIVNRNGRVVGVLPTSTQNAGRRPSLLANIGNAATITERASQMAQEKHGGVAAIGKVGTQVTSVNHTTPFEEYVLELAGKAKEHESPEYILLKKYNFLFVLQDDIHPDFLHHVANVTVMYENDTDQRVVGIVQSMKVSNSK